MVMRSQWLSPAEIDEIQQKKLQKMIHHAYENVPYYRRLFDSVGIKPGEIRDPNDLLRVPITTKKQIQALPLNEITAKGLRIDHCTQVRTSGSTGIPLTVLIGPKDLRVRGAVFMRSLFESGYRLTDKTVRVTNVFREVPRHWYQFLGIRREEVIDVFQKIDDQIRQLQEAKPDILNGLPASLRLIAETIKQRKIEGIRPKRIITGGEILSEETRETLQEGFGATVVDFYNSWEFGNIAWECDRHAGYHINTDSVLFELIREGKRVPPGERGEVFLTGLNAFAMPFIRYRIGDIGVLSDRRCACGRGFPLLERIEGRTDDQITLSKGRVISPFTITTVLRFIPGIGQFRFVQKSEREFEVNMIRGNDFDLNTLEKIKTRLEKILGTDAQINVEVVDEIPRDPSGKIRAVLSELNH